MSSWIMSRSLLVVKSKHLNRKNEQEWQWRSELSSTIWPDLDSVWPITPLPTICLQKSIFKSEIYTFWEYSCPLLNNNHGNRKIDINHKMNHFNYRTRLSLWLDECWSRLMAQTKRECYTADALRHIVLSPKQVWWQLSLQKTILLFFIPWWYLTDSRWYVNGEKREIRWKPIRYDFQLDFGCCQFSTLFWWRQYTGLALVISVLR